MTALERIARTGEPCPTNDVIAERNGLPGRGAVQNAIERLERKGYIQVERAGRWRRITIVATGESSAPIETLRTGTPQSARVRRPSTVPVPNLSSVSPIAAPLPIAEGSYSAPVLHFRDTGWQPQTCQYLEGEPRERKFCGEPVQDGSSYCPTHHTKCWIKASKAKRWWAA